MCGKNNKPMQLYKDSSDRVVDPSKILFFVKRNRIHCEQNVYEIFAHGSFFQFKIRQECIASSNIFRQSELINIEREKKDGYKSVGSRFDFSEEKSRIRFYDQSNLRPGLYS